ncbi:MAG: bifunctional molybdenum cofactor biosynthesis protein MoaC/MoaB, partial [bacterium]
VFEVARAAAALAAKRTAELIPLCHNLPVDFVGVEYETKKNAIVVRTHVKAIWKTGVEMEALVAASIAALTIYDMLKPMDDTLKITTVRLLEKRGGKSQIKVDFPHPIMAAVVVASDSSASGKRADESGKIVVNRLAGYGIKAARYRILPDEVKALKAEFLELVRSGFDLVITTGGTGLSPRDVTADATKAVIDREVLGIAEAARSHGQRRTPTAMLSRATAGTKGKTLILNLPGSPKGVAESLDALLPALFHSFWMLEGGGH